MRERLQCVAQPSGATIVPAHGGEAAVLSSSLASLGARGLHWQMGSRPVCP